MAQSSILLTGAGGAALPALIDGLRAKGYRVVTVDADINAAGLYLADRGYRIPLASDPEFIPVMRRVCHAEAVAALVPLVDEELLPTAKVAAELGIALIGPLPAFTALCLDKYLLMQRLTQAELPVPKTRLLGESVKELVFPQILKPRVGRGSRGIKIVWNQRELDSHLASAHLDTNATMVQRYIQGTEYTVSVVAWRDGQVRAVVPKEIIDKRGITRIAVTRRSEAIDRLCRAIQQRLRADGPFNVQLRLDPINGTPLTFEINPRFSTTVTLTQAAGVDELGSLVDLALGRVSTSDCWKWREGVTLVRRTVDAFLDLEEYAERRHAAEQTP
jgi:carbamoyl-phosphate synthase large subunit